MHFYLVDHLALLLDKHLHVVEEYRKLLDRACELVYVLATRTDVVQGGRRLLASAQGLHQRLRKNGAALLCVGDGLVNLGLSGVRMDDSVLTLKHAGLTTLKLEF